MASRRLLEELLEQTRSLASTVRSDQRTSAGRASTAVVVLFIADRVSFDAALRSFLGLDRQLRLVGERQTGRSHRIRQLLQFLLQLPLVDQVLLQQRQVVIVVVQVSVCK